MGGMRSVHLLLLLALVLVGCDARVAPPTVEEATKVEVQAATRRAELAEKANQDQSKTIEQLKADIQTDKSLIDDAKADIATKLKVINQKEEEHIQAILAWVAGILGLVALAAAVGAWLSPVGTKALLMLSVGCGVLAPVVLALRAYVHFLPYLGCGVLLLAAGVGLWLWRTKAHALLEMGRQWKAYAEELPAEARAKLDQTSLDRQQFAPAIKNVIDTVFRKIG